MTEEKAVDLEDLASELTSLDEQGLSRVSALARQQMLLEQRIADLEAELKETQERFREVAEDLLPAAMAENGLTKIKLSDGSEVSVSKFYGASIPKDRLDAAHRWLADNGYGDLIKNQISASFGRNEQNRASDLFHKLEEGGYSPSQKQWVEPMTLKAFVKEQVESGEAIPTDLFGVFIGEKAKIRRK